MRNRRGNIGLWLGWAIFAGIVFVPSIWFFVESIAGVGAETAGMAATAPVDRGRPLWLLMETIALAGTAAAIALVLGTATGFLTTRIHFPGRRVAFALLLLPFLIPPYNYALSWIEWFAPRMLPIDAQQSRSFVYSLPGTALVLALYLFPWVHLVAGVAFASIERHSEEAARLTMGTVRRLWRITIPLMAGLLALAALFIFVLGLKNLSIPETLQQHVFSTEIMVAYNILDEMEAALKGAAIAGVAFVALGVSLWTALRRRRIAIEGLSAPWTAGEGGPPWRNAWAWLPVLAVFALAAVLPMVSLVRTADGWSNYVTVWNSAHEEAWMGIATAAKVATVCLVLGYVLAVAVDRLPHTVAGITVAAAFLLFALPSPVLDIGLIHFWNRPAIDGPAVLRWLYDAMAAFYDSPQMLVLGQTAAYLPIAVLALWLARRRIDPRMIEAADLAGLPWHARTFRIVLPSIRGWLIGAWLVVFVLALNDVEAAVLLAPAGRPTLSVRVMTLLHYAPDEHVSALCIIQVVLASVSIGVAAALILGATFLSKRFGQGRGKRG